jgi:Xaa-Pro aminopeptidase
LPRLLAIHKICGALSSIGDNFPAMPATIRTALTALLLLTAAARAARPAADKQELQQRRHVAATTFHDGLLLIHAKSTTELTSDGFRQNPAFFYYTGLESAITGILVIDGSTKQSWLFVGPPHPWLAFSQVPGSSPEPPTPEISPATAAANASGLDHVQDWSQLETFLAEKSRTPTTLYYVDDRFATPDLPPNLTSQKTPTPPLWIATIQQRWPSFQPQSVSTKVSSLMNIQSPSELAAMHAAGKSSVPAILAGMRAIHPGASQRSVELAVANACWQNGARGVSFWPWAMAGKNGVIPRTFASIFRYDHLDTTMQAGDLVRLDIGCEVDHYGGDLGRTVPVSGHYTADQHETWNIFVAAYQAGVRTFRAGVTEDQVFEAWHAELQSHRATAKSSMAQRAIDKWSDRKNIPYWELHAMNLDAAALDGPLQAGTTIDFEPIAQIDGQGLYLEDMFLITTTGAEILTPGVPYTADEIESVMH